MPNSPKAADEKRPATPPRQNAQDAHEGSAHDPEEFFTRSDPPPARPAGKKGDA